MAGFLLIVQVLFSRSLSIGRENEGEKEERDLDRGVLMVFYFAFLTSTWNKEFSPPALADYYKCRWAFISLSLTGRLLNAVTCLFLLTFKLVGFIMSFYMCSLCPLKSRAVFLLLTVDAKATDDHQEVAYKRKTSKMIITALCIHCCALYDSYNTLLCMTES